MWVLIIFVCHQLWGESHQQENTVCVGTYYFCLSPVVRWISPTRKPCLCRYLLFLCVTSGEVNLTDKKTLSVWVLIIFVCHQWWGESHRQENPVCEDTYYFCVSPAQLDKQMEGVRVMVFNATFNNISVISWRSVLLVEETGVSAENHWPVASH